MDCVVMIHSIQVPELWTKFFPQPKTDPTDPQVKKDKYKNFLADIPEVKPTRKFRRKSPKKSPGKKQESDGAQQKKESTPKEGRKMP